MEIGTNETMATIKEEDLCYVNSFDWQFVLHSQRGEKIKFILANLYMLQNIAKFLHSFTLLCQIVPQNLCDQKPPPNTKY